MGLAQIYQIEHFCSTSRLQRCQKYNFSTHCAKTQKVITQKICTHVLTVEATNGLTHPAIEVPVLGSVLEIEPVQVPLVLVAQLAVLHVPALPEGRFFSRYRPLSAYRRNSCR